MILQNGWVDTASSIMVNELPSNTEEIREYRCIEGMHRVKALQELIQNKHLSFPDNFKINVKIFDRFCPLVEVMVASCKYNT